MQKRNYKSARAAELREQAYQSFISFLDDNFYEGYAQGLAKDYPLEFNIQLNEYYDNYFNNPRHLTN